MKKKLVHVLLDDKFTDYAINEFSQVSDENEFVIITVDKSGVVKHVKEKSKAQILSYQSTAYKDFLKNVGEYKAVIFHSLQASWNEELFANLGKTIRVGWVFWGGEVYDRTDLCKSFLGKKTLQLYQWKQIKRTIKRIIKFRLHKNSDIGNFKDFPLSVFKRINVCITDLKEDYDFARKVFNVDFEYAWYNYYTIEDMLGALKDAKITGNNILLGNSMTLSNNHLEAFDMLSKFDLKSRKVITPLSYGDVSYRNVIYKAGEERLKNNFVPLMNFIPLAEYNNHVLSCSICVMNHYRHQALGNILTSLWFGSKVYISERSTTYSYLKRLGVIIYSVEKDLKPENPKALEPLTDTEIDTNKRILSREYGSANILLKTKELTDLMLEGNTARVKLRINDL